MKKIISRQTESGREPRVDQYPFICVNLYVKLNPFPIFIFFWSFCSWRIAQVFVPLSEILIRCHSNDRVWLHHWNGKLKKDEPRRTLSLSLLKAETVVKSCSPFLFNLLLLFSSSQQYFLFNPPFPLTVYFPTSYILPQNILHLAAWIVMTIHGSKESILKKKVLKYFLENWKRRRSSVFPFQSKKSDWPVWGSNPRPWRY